METNNVAMTQIAQALASIGTPASPNIAAPREITPKTPKGKPAPLTKEQKEENAYVQALNQTMSDLEDTGIDLDVIQAIGEAAWQRRAQADAWDATFAEYVAKLHPSGTADYAVYKPIAAAITTYFDTYPAKCYRDAVRAMHKRTYGDKPPAHFTNYLPTAGNASNGNSRGTNAKKWSAGVRRMTEGLLERVQKAPKQDVDASTLREFVAAFKALQAVEAKLFKACNFK